MTKLKQKLIAGILSGAMIFGGGIAVNSAYAGTPAKHQEFGNKHERKPMDEEQINNYAHRIAEYYGLDQTEIAAALKERVHFEDVKMAATLAKLSGKSFAEVLSMKVDWRQVEEKLGVNHEQIKEFKKSEMLEGLAERSKLDSKTVEGLLKENYSPRDIAVAGIIANASGKNVKNVFAKRKINNSWDDVAKEFGVDLSKVMPHERRHKRAPQNAE